MAASQRDGLTPRREPGTSANSGGRGDAGPEPQEQLETDGQRGAVASPWEWLIAGFSTLLVLGVIGFLLYEAFAKPGTPPQIEVRVDSVITTGTGYLVEFRVRNSGGLTAAGLTVEGELRSDTGSIETSSVTIDYVPAEATRHGGLFFSEDPRRYQLHLRATGYDRP